QRQIGTSQGHSGTDRICVSVAIVDLIAQFSNTWAKCRRRERRPRGWSDDASVKDTVLIQPAYVFEG
ncbi:MAG: hypothetical protein AAF664_21180, partial [Planctomycetota bacterium]